jgi:peptide/nickel transport system ATP-binding protein
VTFEVPLGKTVGIVGESGCGKSVMSLSLMQLVQAPQGQIVAGEIRYASSQSKCYNIAKMPRDKMLHIRGREISMIFQEPMTSLNPVFTIGSQIDEVVLLHEEGSTPESAKARSIDMLKLVGIAMPEKVYSSYPHELSGGMRQRAVIAMALSCNPRLIIADEPTTALDVTIQAQILDLLRDIKHKMSGSIMLITHDLGVIAEMADYVVVMYAGRVVEKGTVEEIFHEPMHPYTVGLMRSKPSMNKDADRLYSIPGQVPSPINMPDHCYFLNRCEKCLERCQGDYPGMLRFSDSHYAACYLYEENIKNQQSCSEAGSEEGRL